MRIDFDQAVAQPHAISGELLGERRWRAAVLQPVFITVPRTGDAAVDDATLADRAVLMRADIGQCADPVTVAKYRNALAIRRGDDARALVGD